MAHESFEDEETAKIMNEKFINIKVDREERPDLDYVFQRSLSILTGTQGVGLFLCFWMKMVCLLQEVLSPKRNAKDLILEKF